MKKSNIISICMLLLVWQLAGMAIGNDIILPLPLQVFGQMGSDLSHPRFITIVLSTLQKSLGSFGIALLIGTLLGILAGANRLVENFFRPVEILLKTIPNITYMFLLLMWLSSERAVSYVIFFIVFPVIYASVLQGMKGMDQDQKDVLLLYGETVMTRFWKIYLPQIYPFMKSSIFSTLSLSIKVGVMAEVLGQVKFGIGKEMYLNKLNLDMIGVFSWTIWIVLLVTMLESFVKFVLNVVESKL